MFGIRAVAEDKDRQRNGAQAQHDEVEEQERAVVGAQRIIQLHAQERHDAVGEGDKGHVEGDDERAILLGRHVQQHLYQAQVAGALGNADERADDDEDEGPQRNRGHAGDEHGHRAEHQRQHAEDEGELHALFLVELDEDAHGQQLQNGG